MTQFHGSKIVPIHLEMASAAGEYDFCSRLKRNTTLAWCGVARHLELVECFPCTCFLQKRSFLAASSDDNLHVLSYITTTKRSSKLKSKMDGEFLKRFEKNAKKYILANFRDKLRDFWKRMK